MKAGFSRNAPHCNCIKRWWTQNDRKNGRARGGWQRTSDLPYSAEKYIIDLRYLAIFDDDTIHRKTKKMFEHGSDWNARQTRHNSYPAFSKTEAFRYNATHYKHTERQWTCQEWVRLKHNTDTPRPALAGQPRRVRFNWEVCVGYVYAMILLHCIYTQFESNSD